MSSNPCPLLVQPCEEVRIMLDQIGAAGVIKIVEQNRQKE
jgi:hypothetical protein